MGKDKSSKRSTKRMPTIDEKKQYEKARRELLEILKIRIPSVIEYENYFEENHLNEIIPAVHGWFGICATCFKPLKSEGKDLNQLDTKKCEKTKYKQPCYILGKRCGDIQLNGIKCRNLGKQLKAERLKAGIIIKEKARQYKPDPINERWHFLRRYLYRIDYREDKKYCSNKCKKTAQNKRNYTASILKSSS